MNLTRTAALTLTTMVLSSGCLQQSKTAEIPATPGKLCTLIAGVSAIQVSIDTNADLPKFLTGSVNGLADFDECADANAGLSTREITYNRTDDDALDLQVLLPHGTALHGEFFGTDGQPNRTASFSLVLYGRNSCDEAPVHVATLQKSLTWTEMFPNGRDCGASGFQGR
jgi:hypothetical protein